MRQLATLTACLLTFTVTYNIICTTNEVNGVEAGTVTLSSSGKSGTKSLFDGDNVWPNSAEDKVLGGSTDTWGETWTTDHFNSASLKVELQDVEQSISFNDHDATVNSVKIRVCYEP